MIALIQRVTEARVEVDGLVIGSIGSGVLALIGVRQSDTAESAKRLAARLLGFRIFNDLDGRMNLSVRETAGGLLLVPQFTLAADTRSGTRPGFSKAAPPAVARPLFDALAACVRESCPRAGTGRFGAIMRVTLTNDGPVTFWLET